MIRVFEEREKIGTATYTLRVEFYPDTGRYLWSVSGRSVNDHLVWLVSDWVGSERVAVQAARLAVQDRRQQLGCEED